MILEFRTRPTPAFYDMDELLREQLGPLLEQAEEDGEGGEELIQLFSVFDDAGSHVYDFHLFCGEDGQLHQAGTTEYVASFSQGIPSGSEDTELLEALEAAHAEWLASS